MIRKRPKQEFEFELVLSGFSELTEEIEDALFETGCDDGTLGLSAGVPYLVFAREGKTLREAVLSAIRDVESAGCGVRAEWVQSAEGSEFCSVTDIARRIGKSRELVRKYFQGERGPGGFPSPIGFVSGQSHLFRWSQVADWLIEHQLADVAEVPKEFDQINAYLLSRDPRLLDEAPGMPASISAELKETQQALAEAARRVGKLLK